MSNRRPPKAVRLMQRFSRLFRAVAKAIVTGLLRMALVGRRRRAATGGFVLPTTVLLVLVVSLTAGALSYRAFNSSTRAINETQNRVIYNAATPAVDRARAKLDYLFDDKKDDRLPGGVPPVDFLTSMLLNTEPPATINGVAAPSQKKLSDGSDPYTFPGEKRVDINGDAKLDNAWAFRADTDGNGSADATVIYSLIFSTPQVQTELLTLKDKQKADGAKVDSSKDTQTVPFTRTGPLSGAKAAGCGSSAKNTQSAGQEAGWYQDAINTSILRKNFQIDALVIPDGKGTPGSVAAVPTTLSTLEMQQDRQLSRGNKWGAWFRNDLEVFPGAPFNWNGAMHTEGSLISGGQFNAYLVSSPSSCLFYEGASEVSVTKEPKISDTTTSPFLGLVLNGKAGDDSTGGDSTPFHIHANPPDTTVSLSDSNDSTVSGKKPSDISLNSEVVQKLNEYEAVDGSENTTNLDATQVDDARQFLKAFKGRIRMNAEKPPYVDDAYRADNRYGPKKVYNASKSIPTGGKAGDTIPSSESDLVGDVSSGSDKGAVGLDGYWERRARNEGLRILVGQRLELGNAAGWVAPQDRPTTQPAADYLTKTPGTPAVTAGDGDFSGDIRNSSYGTVATADFTNTDLTKRPDPDNSDNEGDPLYPPTETLTHEARQRRALRDNLSAVQATAVYHAAVDKDTPLACLATTAHFGSPFAIQRSVSFLPTTFTGGELLVDFFNGRGTNGWEFVPPSITDITTSTSALSIALRNLAKFAGDPDGAFPPKQEAGKVHPDPYQTMWGNFSNLRRILVNADGSDKALDLTAYNSLSPADKTYLHTAACTVGMLAYNINQLQLFDPTNVANDSTKLLQDLGTVLADLMNGNADDDSEVLGKEQLATYDYKATGTTFAPEKYNPRDYDRVPAEAFLGKVREYYARQSTANSPDSEKHIRLAELILTSMQVRRDRTYGFRPSPAANTWNYNPYVTHSLSGVSPDKPLLWSSACDPNLFALATKTAGTQYAPYDDSVAGSSRIIERQQLGLSRLCGTVVPSAAIHDFPGDQNYPARGDTANANGGSLLKKSDGTTLVTATELELASPPATPDFTGTAVKSEIGKSKPHGLAQVLPRWPALYYVFPEIAHDLDGAVTTISGVDIDHRQPGNTNPADKLTAPGSVALSALPVAFQPWDEPYIKKVSLPTGVTFNPVQTTPAPATGYLAPKTGTTLSGLTFKSSVDDETKLDYVSLQGLLPADLPVNSAALTPRKSDLSDWVLPTVSSPTYSDKVQNNPPNYIVRPDGAVASVAFLDRVLFNGREGLPARVLDIDLGLLRRNRPDTAKQTGKTEVTPNDVWLPASGLVYAFREDAVREDAINRPASTAACASSGKPCTDARNPDPASQTDPALADFGISIKPVDFVPDPERRPHGFRLRNGTQLARHTSMIGGNFTKDKNDRGIDFISDNTVYIQGHYNLHQLNDTGGGKEDDGDPTNQGRNDRLEEFIERLPTDKPYDTFTFYDKRITLDTNFALPDTDRWRPSAILADSISILSSTFCDGSAIDGFMTAGGSSDTASLSNNDYKGAAKTSEGKDLISAMYPYSGSGAAAYDNRAKGLFAPGCTNGGRSSFLNQNRPSTDTQLTASWAWARENPADIFSPIKISRNGNAFLLPPNRTAAPAAGQEALAQKPPVLADYSITLGGSYFPTTQNPGRPLQTAQNTRVDSILVGSIGPSRKNQSYGGMHNFPVFQESWKENGEQKNLWFAGSFLQLSFSNAATAPYDLEVTEPTGSPPSTSDDTRPYYEPPNRFWGYDPALLLTKTGPIASRFVSTETTRSEFYNEPAANDPYISNLCSAKDADGARVTNLPCPQ